MMKNHRESVMMRFCPSPDCLQLRESCQARRFQRADVETSHPSISYYHLKTVSLVQKLQTHPPLDLLNLTLPSDFIIVLLPAPNSLSPHNQVAGTLSFTSQL